MTFIKYLAWYGIMTICRLPFKSSRPLITRQCTRTSSISRCSVSCSAFKQHTDKYWGQDDMAIMKQENIHMTAARDRMQTCKKIKYRRTGMYASVLG